jgi:tRNA U55 pseudouridine synthase TruB
VRTRAGEFDLCSAWRLDELEEAPLAEEWERIAIAPDATVSGLDAVVIDSSLVLPWEQGKRWQIDAEHSAGPVRVYDSAGNWLGIGEIAVEERQTELRPRKVIPRGSASIRINT